MDILAEAPQIFLRRCGKCRCIPWRRRRAVGDDGGEQDAELDEVMLARDFGTSGSDVDSASANTSSAAPVSASTATVTHGTSNPGGGAGTTVNDGGAAAARSVRGSHRWRTDGTGGESANNGEEAAANEVRGGTAAQDYYVPPPASAPMDRRRVEHDNGPAPREASYTSVEAAILMSLLPHEKWTFHYIRDEDGGEGDSECRVCLTDYEQEEEIVRLPCMHYAHTQCMEQWLVREPRCPVCRTNVREALDMDYG